MIHLESGDNTNTYLDSVVALVTDQGTEHLIADSGPIEFSTVQSDDMKALKGPVQFQQGPQAICDGVQPAPVADDSFKSNRAGVESWWRFHQNLTPRRLSVLRLQNPMNPHHQAKPP